MNFEKYIANNNQLFGVREFTLNECSSQKFLYVYNASGLSLLINKSRNNDISELKVKGKNISFLSSVDYSYPSRQIDSSEFLDLFTAGFLTTAGLINIGSESKFKGKKYTLHGNISRFPVRKSSILEENDEIVIKSETHEVVALTYDLVLFREIRINKFKNIIQIKDKVKNLGQKREIHNILYHFNFGYPFIDENTELKINSYKVRGRTPIAQKDEEINNCLKLSEPLENYEERCFYHYFDEKPKIEVINKELNLIMNMEFSEKTLTNFVEWKMMSKNNYVLGLEPCSSEIDGIEKLAKENKLKYLNPNEEKEYEIKIEFN